MFLLPYDLAKRPGWTFAAALVASTILLTFCSATMALAATPPETRSIAVHVPANALRSPKQAKRLLARLGDAALEVCGGSKFSFPEYRAAVAHSPCYREALARAVNKAGSPILAEVYARLNRNRAG